MLLSDTAQTLFDKWYDKTRDKNLILNYTLTFRIFIKLCQHTFITYKLNFPVLHPDLSL